MPEELFKYSSNAIALCLFENPHTQIIFHGLNLLVCLFSPALWDFILACKSGVEPIYVWAGKAMLWSMYT